MTDDTTFERDLRAALEHLGQPRTGARAPHLPRRRDPEPAAVRSAARGALVRPVAPIDRVVLGLLVAVLAIAVVALILRPTAPPRRSGTGRPPATGSRRR